LIPVFEEVFHACFPRHMFFDKNVMSTTVSFYLKEAKLLEQISVKICTMQDKVNGKNLARVKAGFDIPQPLFAKNRILSITT